MKLAKFILGGIAAIGLTAGAAAQPYDEQASWDDSSSAAYGVDDDMDGRVDRELILEQSDSLA
ncbi:MAG: hypothetical protein ACT4P4_14120 [Betaproteobacteria bacterium]